jgi:hypothetical protein
MQILPVGLRTGRLVLCDRVNQRVPSTSVADKEAADTGRERAKVAGGEKDDDDDGSHGTRGTEHLETKQPRLVEVEVLREESRTRGMSEPHI